MDSMKLYDIYRLAVDAGMEADPRSKKDIEADLRRAKENYDALDCDAQDRFDKDQLWNPYADTRLLHGDPDQEVQGVLWGIDITPGEALLADRLRERGESIDCVIGHHPIGMARSIYPDVMHMMEYMFQDLGVPINVAEGIIGPRIKEVQRTVHVANYNQAVDACRLLDMPLMCLHSPCDIWGQRFVQEIMDRQMPGRVSDVIDILTNIAEYDLAIRQNNQPEVYVGEKHRRAGKIFVKFAGGTSGPKEMYESLSKAGVGTVICMHLPENHIEEAKKAHMNVLVAGHMASDSLGLNLLADKIEERGVTITPCSGFLRVRRR